MTHAKNPVVGGPADDTSVRQFVNLSKELINAALSRDFVSVFKKGSEVLSIVGDLTGMFADGSQEKFGKDVTDEELDSLKAECDNCRAQLKTVGDHEPDPRTIDPASILLILELVSKVIDWIRKRRER